MFIIYGTSARVAVVGQVPLQCPRCGVVAPHALVRRWSVAHIFWVPLFSFGAQHVLGCPSCMAAHPFSPPPGLAPPIPFLQRFGCLMLLLLPLAVLAAMFVAALVMRPTDRSNDNAARWAFWEFERRLDAGRVYGNSPEASDVGTSIQRLLLLGADRSLAPETASIAVRVEPGSPKRVVIVVRLPQLKRCADSWRREFLDKVQDLLRDQLAPGDEVVVGLKGTTFYGATAAGTVGGAWSVQVGSSVSARPLEEAFVPRPEVAVPVSAAPRPCVLQKGPMDCGPAALETVVTFYGKTLTPEARRLMTSTDPGTNLLELKLAAESAGLQARAVKPEEGADRWDVLSHAHPPFIAHLKLEDGRGHFVVVYEVSAEGVQVADPAKGLREIGREEFLALWTGPLLLVSDAPVGDAFPGKDGDEAPSTQEDPR